ncbi:MAG: hypothetical protein JNK64_10735 [Myxococcales bacterium]|nr:hypothetical protein [Myxococcales bacterium]
MSLLVCERCRGFVPSGSECPHCRASERRGRTVTVGAIALAAVLAAGVCVPGCAYGDFAPDPVDAPAGQDAGGDGGGGGDGGSPDAAVR